MSTQRFHFLTLIGRSTEDVDAAIDQILSHRIEDPPCGVGGTDYGKRAHTKIEKLCKALVAAAHELPVLHYATHIDGWAMGNCAFRRFTSPGGSDRAVLGLNWGLVSYSSAMAETIFSVATNARRTAIRRGRRWDSWYDDAVSTAFAAGEVFKIQYTVVVMAECLGPSRMDADVHAPTRKKIPGV